MARSYTWAVFVLSGGFFFLFMAFNTAQNLESTLVEDTQLVNASLALLYGTFTLCAAVVPKLIQLIGPRLAMGIGSIPYVLLVLANCKPSWGTFMPAFFLVGVGAALLWTSQGIALSRLAIAESHATGEAVDLVTSRYNGYFWTGFQFNGAVGLVIASTILRQVPDYQKAIVFMFLGFGAIGAVGTALLFIVPVPAVGAATAPTSDESRALAAHDGLAINPVTGYDDDHDAKKAAASGSSNDVTIADTLRLLTTSRAMALMVPIIVYNGASLGYNSAMWPLAYRDFPEDSPPTVNLIPKDYVGYITAAFFLSNSFCSYLWGALIPRIGRRPLFIGAVITHIAYYAIVMLVLQGKTGLAHESGGAFALVVGNIVIFAIGDSVLESQIPAIIQSPTFFEAERDRDAGNSNLRMWQSLGFTAQFVVGIVAPRNVYVQTYFIAPLFVLAFLCFFILDRRVRSIEAAGKSGAGGGEYTAVASRDEATLAARDGGDWK